MELPFNTLSEAGREGSSLPSPIPLPRDFRTHRWNYPNCVSQDLRLQTTTSPSLPQSASVPGELDLHTPIWGTGEEGGCRRGKGEEREGGDPSSQPGLAMNTRSLVECACTL